MMTLSAMPWVSGSCVILSRAFPVMVAATARVMLAAVQCVMVAASDPANIETDSSTRVCSSDTTKYLPKEVATSLLTYDDERDTPSGVKVPLALMIEVSRLDTMEFNVGRFGFL